MWRYIVVAGEDAGTICRALAFLGLLVREAPAQRVLVLQVRVRGVPAQWVPARQVLVREARAQSVPARQVPVAVSIVCSFASSFGVIPQVE